MKKGKGKEDSGHRWSRKTSESLINQITLISLIKENTVEGKNL